MPDVLAGVVAIVSVGALALAVPAPQTPRTTPPASVDRSVAGVTGRSTLVIGPPPTATRPTVAPSVTAALRSRFRWPLDPRPHVLRRFTVGPAPWSPGHRGVDLAGTPGQAVLTAGTGVVTFAGGIAGVGVVSVTHGDGLRTTYQPVSAQVHVGDRVEAGQSLGHLTDWPGHCPASCLHWGAVRGRTYIDPLGLLGLVLPVLLPLRGPPLS